MFLRRITQIFLAKQRTFSRLKGQKKRLIWMGIMRYGALGLAGLVILVILGFLVLLGFYARELPQPGEVVRQTGFSTKIYDRNMELLYDVYADQNRTPVKIDEVPEYLRNATVAIEDKDFYRHQGFDPLVFLRAPYYLIFEGRIVGGSTLTQQLVKKSVLSDERRIDRKFKQIVLSLMIEKNFDKKQILEMYLNEVPYGGTAYGVGAASQVYFGKPVSKLSLVESAVLAGLPQRPSSYSPFLAKKDETGQLLWQARTLGVLRRMLEDQYITQITYDQAVTELDTLTFAQGKSNLLAPHFVFYVKDKLEEMYGPEVVETGGLEVKTSLDLNLQRQVQEIVSEEVEKVKKLNITNGALLMMNPKNGEIFAMVGSKDFNDPTIDGQFNVVTQGLRQPGSSIKPVVYLTLLQQGYTPATMMIDTPTTFQRNDKEKPYEPKNYDGKFRGPVSMRYSLGSSLNIPAVKAISMVGIENFLTQAYLMGFVTLEPNEKNLQRLGLSVALGGGEVHLIDTVTAFSAFANDGYKVEASPILQVRDKSGNLLFEKHQTFGQKVMETAEAFLINHILSDDSARSLAFGLNSKLNVNPNVAVKTGTTNDQKDNWAIGWSKEVIIGAWVGNSDNTPMKQVASGVSGATPIWQRSMLLALANGFSAPEFTPPEDVEKVEVDAISGYPAHDDFVKKFEYVRKGSLPSLPDPIHTKLKLCRGENKIATDAKVLAGDYEERESIFLEEHDPFSADGKNRYLEGIRSWIESQADQKYKVPTEYCGNQSDVFVNLERPENERSYESEEIEIKFRADAGSGIRKVEIIVDGEVKETVETHQYEGKIKLSKGRHTLWLKAYARDDKTAESGKKKIGVGGESWQEPTPTSTPVPTTAPTPIPTIVVQPTSAPTPTSTPVLTPTL